MSVLGKELDRLYILERELAEAKAEHIKLNQYLFERLTNATQRLESSQKELAEAKLTIRWLRFHCPRPFKPDEFENSEYHRWKVCVKHYEEHLASNPPEEFLNDNTL